MLNRKLLMISTDKLIFQDESAVRARQIEYAKDWNEMHIIVFTKRNSKFKIRNPKQIPSIKSKIQNEMAIAPNCWVYPTGSFSKFKYPFDAIRLGRFIIKRRGITDITCQDPFLAGMAGISLKKQFGISLEIQLHTDISSPNYAKTIGNRIRKALALSYLPKADSIRVVSNRIRDYLVGSLGINQSKITVRPIAIDTGWIRNAPIVESANLHKKYPQFNKIILMVSRLEKEKNIKLAIEAFAEVVKKMPRAGLIIVGNGSQEKHLYSRAMKIVPNNIVFEPWSVGDNLFSYYKTADAFLNTSLFEGYGMTLTEAKAAGCLIISTDVGIVRETGATIVNYDANDVADKIISTLRI